MPHYFCSGCHTLLSPDETTLSYEGGEPIRTHNSPDCGATVLASEPSESSVIAGVEAALLQQGSLLQEQEHLNHSSKDIIKFLSQTQTLLDSLFALQNSPLYQKLRNYSRSGIPNSHQNDLDLFLSSLDSIISSVHPLSPARQCSQCSGPLVEHSGAARTLKCLVCGNIQETL